MSSQCWIGWHSFCEVRWHSAVCLPARRPHYWGKATMALVPSPQWLDTGDNAWQLAAATFVGLQSIPGLVVLYGGIVKKKWAINSAFMAMYAFASVLVVWVLFDYNMAFGHAWLSIAGQTFLGMPQLATSAAFTTGQAIVPDGRAGLLPVCVRSEHRHHSCRFSAGSHELHGVDDLLPDMDDTGLHRRRVQPLGWRLARRFGCGRLLGRLRHPSRRRHVGLCCCMGHRPAAASRPRQLPAQ